MNYNCIFIIGPTASGKSDIAISLARQIKGEIINADSMQIYSNVYIGTARPQDDQMQGVQHHLFGYVKPENEYSVGLYKDEAIKVFEQIKTRCVPIFVGGTGLYVESLIKDYDFAHANKDEKLRNQLQELSQNNGSEYLHNMLKKLDPQKAQSMDKNNTKKIIRAIEILQSNNTGSSKQASGLKPLIIGINLPRPLLYERINQRVDKMMQQGLLKEAEYVYTLPKTSQLKSAIGYKELFDYLDGKVSLEQATNLLKQKSRNYAKRQLTWFRHMDNINWFDITQHSTQDIVKNIIKLYKK